ncbi:hypothetical protein A7U60_g2920 [Sanghuangporus baumii]|uniref:C2 domain-containing protein n=1 Tax=Sanghuangporus baumii TaxID=108892 RepID=A0A9Q5I1D2_SANBA|nr:hypothetical protein A7U60_g2920 [Sanghuangporus baumii]
MSRPSMDTYNVLITIHRAANIPAADIHNLSADPYILATLNAPSRPQPPEEPRLRWRTPTVRATRDPVFNNRWLIGGAPQDGFILKLSVVDEDTKDRDDRLGGAVMAFTRDMMREGFEIKERELKVQKRQGSIVPYILTYMEGILPGHKVRKHNRIVISAKVIGRTNDQDDFRVHTIGPNTYSLHFSPMIGSVVNRRNRATKDQPNKTTGDEKRPVSASTFVACKLQLTGPVPKELHHHYVGYNWFIKMLYSRRGLSGRLLFHSLRKQYRTVYSYDKSTLYGIVEPKEDGETDSGYASTNSETQSQAFAKQFLEMTNYGRGGRLQTYVLTLDAQWRFCETGDEFAIDFLSKHMMHADGEQIVAYAGEFFVRRIAESHGGELRHEAGRKDTEKGSGYPAEEDDDDPSHYELVIDNDSGTYRPPESTLPVLQTWLEDKHRLGALGRVTAMHCSDKKLQALKKQRKELKKHLAGGELPKRQQVRRSGSSTSSIRVDGRKLSSGEVERIVSEKERENEARMSDGGPQQLSGKQSQRT